MLEKENQLWKAFEQMAEDRYYGYIPPIIKHDGSFLAENLKGLINELADWRKNAVHAITRCQHFDRISAIQIGSYDGMITAQLNGGGIEAMLTISNEQIAYWANIGRRTMVKEVIDFANGGLCRFCEESGVAPRLESIIQSCMHSLVTRVDSLNRLLDEQIHENRSAALQ